MKWPWSKTPHEKMRARWRKSYGGYVPFPDKPMTPEEAKEYLTERFDCGCVTNWWYSPPSGRSCQKHMLGRGSNSPPTYFIYARDVLDGALPHDPR